MLPLVHACVVFQAPSSEWCPGQPFVLPGSSFDCWTDSLRSHFRSANQQTLRKNLMAGSGGYPCRLSCLHLYCHLPNHVLRWRTFRHSPIQWLKMRRRRTTSGKNGNAQHGHHDCQKRRMWIFEPFCDVSSSWRAIFCFVFESSSA